MLEINTQAENFIQSLNNIILDDRQILLSFLIDNDSRYDEKLSSFIGSSIRDMHLGRFSQQQATQKVKLDIVDEVNAKWIRNSGIAFDKGFTELQKWNVSRHLVSRFEANYANGIYNHVIEHCVIHCL